MNELVAFSNAELGSVRCLMIENEPWFVAIDVCECLDIRTDTIRSILEEDEVDTINPNTIGVPSGGRDMLIVSESGMYSLILRSRKPGAKKVKHWITHEVLPALRKTGTYTIMGRPLPTDYLTALEALVACERDRLATQNTARVFRAELNEKREECNALNATLTEAQPRIQFAASVEETVNSCLIKDLATIITQAGFPIGQNQLFAMLRNKGVLCKSKGNRWNRPTQKYIDRGWFKVTEHVIQTSHGLETRFTTRVTGNGQLDIVSMFLRGTWQMHPSMKEIEE